MVTLSDVANRAGVSVSAVSRVLTDAPSTRVSEATRQRIQDAARELGYRPNYAARALKFARTNAIGLIVPDLTNAIFTELMRGVEDEARERDYMVLLARAEGMTGGEDLIPWLIGEGRVDGVLVQVGDNMRDEDLAALLEGQLPVVFLNSIHPNGMGSVLLEDDLGIRIAVEHLLGLGHVRIAFAGGVARSDSAQRREAGFRAAMADAGVAVDEALVTREGFEPDAGRAAMRRLSAAVHPPTAVVAANINAAYGVLLEARAQGLRVPGDLSVVAMHDAWTADSTWPPLTTVRMPLYELGRAAMSGIVERLAAGSAPDLTVRDPAPVLIVRESTAAPSPR